MRIAVILIASLCVVSLSGCGKRTVTCKQDNKDYVGAKELPPLKSPEGLDPPDTRNTLKVPPLDTPERVRGREEPCLDVPPPFASPKAAPAATPATPGAPAATPQKPQ